MWDSKSLSIIKVLGKYITRKWSCYLCVNYNKPDCCTDNLQRQKHRSGNIRKNKIFLKNILNSVSPFEEKNVVHCAAKTHLFSCSYKDFTDTWNVPLLKEKNQGKISGSSLRTALLFSVFLCFFRGKPMDHPLGPDSGCQEILTTLKLITGICFLDGFTVCPSLVSWIQCLQHIGFFFPVNLKGSRHLSRWGSQGRAWKPVTDRGFRGARAPCPPRNREQTHDPDSIRGLWRQ